MADTSRLYHQIRAFVLRDIRQALAGQTSLGGLAASAGAGHSHDDRYYSESEADSRFVNAAGDNVTGNITANSGVTFDGVDISDHRARHWLSGDDSLMVAQDAEPSSTYPGMMWIDTDEVV